MKDYISPKCRVSATLLLEAVLTATGEKFDVDPVDPGFVYEDFDL